MFARFFSTTIAVGVIFAFAGVPVHAQGDIAAKVQVCNVCHGANGVPMDPKTMPNIWGQQPYYLLKQLANYRNGMRDHAIMSPIAKGLQEGDLRPDQVDIIAKRLGVTKQDVIDMNRRLGGDKSINVSVHDDGDAAEWQDYLVDQSPSPEAIVVEQDERERQRKALIAAIDVLDGRERSIFEARFLADEPPTLEEISTEFKVSRERIRQIEARAFEKVRKAAKARASSAPAAMLAISDA